MTASAWFIYPLSTDALPRSISQCVKGKPSQHAAPGAHLRSAGQTTARLGSSRHYPQFPYLIFLHICDPSEVQSKGNASDKSGSMIEMPKSLKMANSSFWLTNTSSQYIFIVFTRCYVALNLGREPEVASKIFSYAKPSSKFHMTYFGPV